MAQKKATKAKAKQEIEEVEVPEEVEADYEMDEIFPGGPTEQEVELLKQKTGGEVFMTRILETYFIWRPLKRKEYRDIMALPGADAYYREEAICQKCVLWPEDANTIIRHGNAGLATILSETISSESGFTNDVQSIKL